MFFFHFMSDLEPLPPKVAKFLEKDKISWDKLEKLLIAFRDTRSDLTVGTLATFLYIARRSTPANTSDSKKLTIKYLATALKMSYPTCARHCDVLSEGARGREGLMWIQKMPMEDQRSKYVLLTPAGVEALTKMIDSIKAK